MTDASNESENDEAPLPFEQAMERLEQLVGALESGETPLAELVEKFEEGSKLLRHCERQLKQAELRVRQLDPETGATEDVEPEESA